MGTVYLLHFDRPLHHARHYLGYSRNLSHRLAEHQEGRGARLTQAVRLVGGSWELARTWAGDRRLERQLKRWKKSARFCPVCRSVPPQSA